MLTVVTGPMFSGKTSKLLSLASANHYAGKTTALFTPSNDSRYVKDSISAHTGEMLPARALDINHPEDLMFKPEYAKCHRADVFIFDECQFYNYEKFAWLIRELLGKEMICAGLPNDFQGFPFGPMPYLLAAADKVISLQGVCAKCKQIGTATRTYRKTKEKTQVVVGGSEAYESRCFDCWKDVLDEV